MILTRLLVRLLLSVSPAAALRRAALLPPEQAFALYARAAKSGIAEAEYRLGRCYLEGAGVPASADEAALWLERAAEHRHAEARALLAGLCLRGYSPRDDRLFPSGPPRGPDFATAAKWARAAAEAGDPLAALNYGVFLAGGIGLDRDEQQAVAWLRRAADALPAARYLYGRMLAEGRGVGADPAEGRAAIARAAATGMAAAETELAAMMLSGTGGARDPVTAWSLLEKAARKGDDRARRLMAEERRKAGNTGNRQTP